MKASILMVAALADADAFHHQYRQCYRSQRSHFRLSRQGSYCRLDANTPETTTRRTAVADRVNHAPGRRERGNGNNNERAFLMLPSAE
jgi:hypothetical protein